MMSNTNQIEWTPQLVKKFWDHFGREVQHQETYFSRQKGPALVRYIKRFTNEFGLVGDFGAGPGYLLDVIANDCKGFVAFDYSDDSLKALEERFNGVPGYQGARPIDSVHEFEGRLDTVFCLEIFEHLFDDQVMSTMSTLRALLKPGGRVVITVPNEEDLKANMVYCPVSDIVFHRWQHMRSWCVSSMREVAEQNGFVTERCEAISLHEIGRRQKSEDREHDVSMFRRLGRSTLRALDLKSHIMHLSNCSSPQKAPLFDHRNNPPNLLYIGVNPSR